MNYSINPAAYTALNDESETNLSDPHVWCENAPELSIMNVKTRAG